ncbi:MAG: NADH:flavin oxidoreductase, partial [Sphingomonadales bacterium]|nr:NADH:flavin oxidoreductase [Sphingomonadales bacterium]
YGGTIEKRMTFPSEVLKKVLGAVGKDLAVIVKYSMTDGPKGNDISDGIAVAKRLEADGAHMAVLSNGLNVESITAMFGSPLPPATGGGNAIIKIGSWIQSLTAPKDVVFRDNYLRELAQQVRANVDMPLAYLGGVQSLEGVQNAMDDGFDTIAMGRALVFDPNFVNELQSGAITRSGCTACNRCVTMMYTPGGTSCIESPYKPDPKLNQVGAAS